MNERFARQIPLFAEEGQQKLAASRVLVIGAGGLGSPVLYYLCAAGIGTIGIVDNDVVSLSNLNRQILYKESDIGKQKSSAAAAVLLALNQDLSVHEYSFRLDEETLAAMLPEYDIVVNCVDSLKTRQWIGKTCKKHHIPLVEAAIEGFFGFIMSINKDSACFSCLTHMVNTGNNSSPAVLGSTAGTLGTLQAAECIKILLGIGQPLFNRVLIVDILNQEHTTIELEKNPLCPICGADK